MIKYLGSKRRLVPHIEALASRLPQARTAVDLFAGTTRVAQALKRCGLHVHANDLAAYTEVLATAYVEADADLVDAARIGELLDHLAALPPVDGYVTETFCRQARYFQPRNGMRIDAIRAELDQLGLDRVERAILLTSLVEAADRVDSTTGVQMAYLKQWAARSTKPLELRMPALLPGSGTVTRADANQLAPTLAPVDLAYLDPPYNQHAYRGNYHVWETLVRGDEPEAYGIARKRVDCRTEKSAYNSRPGAWPALEQLIRSIDARWLLVSFNDEGFVPPDALRELLTERGEVGELAIAHERYVGARIGIHSPAGVKVGTVGRLRNVEHLFLVGDGAADIAADVLREDALAAR
ncbi:MAG: methyltransferase [Thermoleophilia bacterium]|nr:methyltransferase [Thermoleophilia bacterium]